MAQTGRPPKPIEQKIRAGNVGKRKLPTLTAVTALPVRFTVPVPHRPLMTRSGGGLGAGGELWKMIWESGCSWLKPECDTELVMLVCEQTDERTILRERMFRIGDWRDRAGLRMLEKQIAHNLSQLGFTPADRARLGNTSANKVDALQEFRAKVQSQRSQA